MLACGKKDLELVNMLRVEGIWSNLFEGEGRDGKQTLSARHCLKRNREKELMRSWTKMHQRAFIVAYEPTNFKGGYLVKSMKKAVKMRQ